MARSTARASSRNLSLGRYGEDAAVRYLQASGLTVIQRNWRCRSGEIDIVALDRDELVICEVKSRTDDRCGGPLAAITPAKLQRLRGLAAQWLADHQLAVSGIRIDIVGIQLAPKGRPTVTHLVGVG